MEQFMVEVTNNGVLDYLPIRGVNEKSALKKAKSMYLGVTVHNVVLKDVWKLQQFGSESSPTLLMEILNDLDLDNVNLEYIN